MNIAVPRNAHPEEPRTALTPAAARRLAALPAEVRIEAGLGESLGFTDADFEAAGARVSSDRTALLHEADLVLLLRKPAPGWIPLLRPGTALVGFLDPFNDPDLVRALAAAGVEALSMELIPRTTRAQSMDALSSQASLAGYAAVMVAAAHSPRVFPMMMTPAGTITPANVFVLGAGVAGLQAIATARRLGARVTAFDIRPSSQTEVESLGAKFLKMDIGETGQTADGYARELTEEQKRKQREGQARAIAQSHVVITTAQVFGRRAPVLVTRDMVARMQTGSVIVDMAVESGGNVEGSRPDEIVETGGVRIIGFANLPGRVAVHASEMYAANLVNLVTHGWKREAGRFIADPADEIFKACLLTHGGQVVNERLRAAGKE